MNIFENYKKKRENKIADKIQLYKERLNSKAYKVGYQGRCFKPFTVIGEDSEQSDIECAVRVFLINRDPLVSVQEIDAAIVAFTPALNEYIQGLKDGCREQGNDHLLDLCAPIKRLRAQYKSQQTNIGGSF